MDRTIIYNQEQMRAFDITAFEKDVLMGLAYSFGDYLGVAGTPVVAGLAATATTPTPSLTINLAAGRIYKLAAADSTAVGTIPADTTQIVQQGLAIAQQLVMSTAALVTGQSQWVLIQAEFAQNDSVRSGDPNGGVMPFYNAANPTQPLNGQAGSGVPLPTVRAGTCTISVVAGSPAATGSEEPPNPTGTAVPLYLIDLTYGQTQITTNQILVAGPSVGLNVPNDYPEAPFFRGVLAAHHGGSRGQAPKIDLTAEVQDILPLENLPASGYLGTLSAVQLWAGNPNGHVAGNAATVSIAPDKAYDITNKVWYTCTTTGNASTAVWTADSTGGGGGGGVTFQNPWDDYCVDTGTTNAMIGTPLTAISLADGTKLRIRIANTNTGATTLNASGTGATAIRGANGTALQGGELPAGSIADFQYSSAATAWILTSSNGTVQAKDATASHHLITKGQLDAAIAGVAAPPKGMEVHTSGSGSFTVPANVTAMEVILGGAGGGSGGASGAGYPGPGGGGALAWGVISVTPGQIIAWAVGAGGTAGTSSANGGTGGTTTFGASLAAAGGAGGTFTSTGYGTSGVGGTPTVPPGWTGIALNGVPGQQSGESNSFGGYVPMFGAPNPNGATSHSSGQNGRTPGQGASANCSYAGTGFAGAGGFLILKW